MDPTKIIIPTSVWEQIPVVLVFAGFIGVMLYYLVKMFIKGIADVNAHYAGVLKETNEQWQKYIDARSETTNMVNKQMVEQLGDLAKAIGGLSHRFDAHDQWERELQNQKKGE